MNLEETLEKKVYKLQQMRKKLQKEIIFFSFLSGVDLNRNFPAGWGLGNKM